MNHIVFFGIITVLVYTKEIDSLPEVKFVQPLFKAKREEHHVKEADVRYILSTRKNPKQLIEQETIRLDVDKPTKFIIHGWLEDNTFDWYKEMKQEFLKYDDVNVIFVDWKKLDKCSYFSSAKNTKLVGEITGRFIVRNRFPPEKVHLIGNSVGSHIAGLASKYVKNATGARIERITGLDPTRPYFNRPEITEKLSKEDAEIVDVIHTDAGFWGLARPLGTLDIYVNGGSRSQPGCQDGNVTFNYKEAFKNAQCSHSRGHEYFIQSINNADIVCKRCDSYENMKKNDCSENGPYKIVHQNVTKDMKGICLVSTTSFPPYFVSKNTWKVQDRKKYT